MKRIVECVPNFSEGRNKDVINKIVAAITGAASPVTGEKVKLLDVDPGALKQCAKPPSAVCRKPENSLT